MYITKEYVDKIIESITQDTYIESENNGIEFLKNLWNQILEEDDSINLKEINFDTAKYIWNSLGFKNAFNDLIFSKLKEKVI